ncbi:MULTISPECIES: hypothetical protein [unclassified Streptomyces]|uniref:SCO2400 family protein n=1 Tax=unclassified Streptomyces TaxID=2593676 RepID=UPI00202E741A|nr:MULTISPECIES: hypothetical protein [unclassified Streptomyces]MCM1972054.1 hypothetical protein [Streptomyces sp. G1]MCX5125614.1 hypothetical protein [Streptomyces sp. NBC_00347]
MDYCIACRRYLNGALACAGCGTPVERLISAAPAAPAPGSADVFGSDPAALADVYADSLVVLSGERGDGRGRGRAQSRAADRRRAGHRRRRRTALTVGLGLMFAAAATLGLARLATDGERTDRAATVVLTDDAGPAEPAPLPGLTEDPAPPTGTASAKGQGTGSTKATAGGAKPGGTGRSTGGTGASASGSSGPSRSASPTPTSAAPTPSGSSGSATPGKPPGPKKPDGKPRPNPKPTPTATPDCWWIFC